MSRKVVNARLVWEDRFQTPTCALLLAGLSREHAAVVSRARKALLTSPGGTEAVVWHGLPWRWTLVYRMKPSARPFAYIIPQPARPRVALPLEVRLIDSLSPRQLTRTLRDGLAAGVQVGSICWAQWDLTSAAQCDEIVALVRMRFEQSLAPVA